MTVERMDLASLERPALEMYARNLDAALDICEAERARLQAKVNALGNVLHDIEAALDKVVHAVVLAHMVLLDTSTPEDDE